MFYAFPFIIALPFAFWKLVQTAVKKDDFKAALPWVLATAALLCLDYYFAMQGIAYTIANALV